MATRRENLYWFEMNPNLKHIWDSTDGGRERGRRQGAPGWGCRGGEAGDEATLGHGDCLVRGGGREEGEGPDGEPRLLHSDPGPCGK